MRGRRSLAVVAILALAAAAALQRAGGGSLAPPPLDSWRDLERWYAARDTATVVVAMLRGLALVGAGWLATAAGVQLLVAMSPGRVLGVLADALSPAFIRTLSHGAAGLSVTAGLAIPSFAEPIGNPPGTAVMVPLDDGASTTTDTRSQTPPTVELSLTSTTTTPPQHPQAPDAPTTPSPAVPEEVVVLAGASFWTIAEDEAGGRDLVSYWMDLIEANRDRLVDRTNPDLLYPGQVLRLPRLT